MRKPLYPSYRPRGIQPHWEHCSMVTDTSGDLFRKRGIPPGYGDPVECVAWFDNDNEALRCVVADYPNGKRVTYRVNDRGWKLDIASIPATPTIGEPL